MKKIIVLGGLAMFLSSCGGETTVCDCAASLEEMSKDFQDAMGDEEKMKSLEGKYDKINEDCEKLAEEIGQEEFQKQFEDC